MPEANILLVDDDVDIRHIVHRVLSDNHRYTVTTCKNASEALEYLDKHCYDLVISDIRMPGMDGIGLVQEISQRCPDLAIILIGAYQEDMPDLESVRQVVTGFLPKPFDIDELLEIVNQILTK
ncbi:MAG: response regulator [Fidelibacterota bacterium]|nr:MAG: response regulator [Candidatus Neomarinimicrobiota bacterium]